MSHSEISHDSNSSMTSSILTALFIAICIVLVWWSAVCDFRREALLVHADTTADIRYIAGTTKTYEHPSRCVITVAGTTVILSNMYLKSCMSGHPVIVEYHHDTAPWFMPWDVESYYWVPVRAINDNRDLVVE